MSFSFNGNTPRKIIFNNQDVKKLIYNGNVVWKKKRLPDEYQEVEYIESTGKEYIDTGITGTNNTKVDIEFQATGTNFLPFGARRTASSDCFAIWAYSSTVGTNLRIGFDGTNGYTGKDTTTDKYHIIHSKDGTYVNNELVWTTGTIRTFTTPQNLIVFGYYNTATTMALSAIRLYHLKLWENNIIVRDFIPCYRNSDGEIGLYDSINDIFYTNQGTGVFIKGKYVYTLPNEYQEVEYIESTGTQYIDTGISGTRYITAHLDMQFTKQSSSTMIIIAWSTGAGRWFGKGSSNTYSAGNNAISDIDALLHKEIEVTFTKSDITFVIDGTTYSKATTSSSSITYTLFAGRQVDGDIRYYSKAKLYKAVIQENGNTIMDLVPCYRKSDEEVGLYDFVSKEFYTNQGTGTFTKGPDVN